MTWRRYGSLVLILILSLVVPASAQEHRHPSGITPPATCSVGSVFYDTDAAAGSRNLVCDPANTWIVAGGASMAPLSSDGTNLTLASGHLLLPVGTAGAPPIAFADDLTTGIFSVINGAFSISAANGERFRVQSSVIQAFVDQLVFGSTAGLSFSRDANGVFSQRNGTNPQTYRLDNTFTSLTNREFGKLEWASNVFNVGTEKGSGGGSARAMALMTDNTARVILDTTGSVTIGGTAPATPLAGSLFSTGTTFASLGTPSNGTIIFCTDCAAASAVDQTCAGSGTGSLAVRQNGAWKCIS